jgi:hypothetical protein
MSINSKTMMEADAKNIAGLTPDLSVDWSDPSNARYLLPLDRKEDEEMAQDMAEAIYSAVIDGIEGKVTEEVDVMTYNRALVDSRRMMLDREYYALFGGDLPDEDTD